MKYIVLTMLCFSFLAAFDGLRFSSLAVKNGESLLVMYTNQENISDLKLHFGKKAYQFSPHPVEKGLSYLILPVSYDMLPGSKKTTLSYLEDGIQTTHNLSPITVVKGNYPAESLRVDPSKIKLSPSDQKRAEKEYFEAMKIYHRYTPKFQIKCSTCVPMDSAVTSKFGNERLFNGERKSYHSGIDFRAKTPTEVHAIGKGVVVLKADRFYAGYSLIIDHGHGIYSGYYHLSKANVDLKDTVEKNQVIALSGDSGRVTGPHLHFSVKVHGITVNPKVLLEQIDMLFKQDAL